MSDQLERVTKVRAAVCEFIPVTPETADRIAARVIDILRPELEDARRYEWLRTHGYKDRIGGNDCVIYGPGFSQSAPDALDSAIDDSMGYSDRLAGYCQRQKDAARQEGK